MYVAYRHKFYLSFTAMSLSIDPKTLERRQLSIFIRTPIEMKAI